MNAMVQSLKDMGQVRLALLAGIAVALIGFFVYLSMSVSTPAMSPLYSGLSIEDSAQIVSELDGQGVKYELRANGTQIMVPSDQMLRLRLSLAQEGLPSGGSIVGYEIFDRGDAMGTSNFVMNVNMLRALEGELARTIGSFSKVESARVHLVVPKRELFTRDKEEPTASVMLNMRGGNEMNKQEVAAITHLVATAVPGLKAQHISVATTKGEMLAKGVSDDEDPQVYESAAEEYRIAFENRLRARIEDLLAQSVGAGKVKAHVTANIDFDRVVTNSETFDPESQVARSVQTNEERENSTEKDATDNVSAANNLPDAKQAEAGAQSSRNTERAEETTNFEISKVVENHVKETGTVNRLSVAVLVDGRYAPNEAGEQVYQPRPEEELAQFRQLVESAIGYDKARGDTVEVVNMQFTGAVEKVEEEGPLGWLKDDLDNIIQTLVLGGVAILAILLIIRPLINRAIEASIAQEEAAEAEQAALAGPALSAAQLTDQSGLEDEEDMINIDRIQGRVKSSTFRKLNELIDKHPDETLTVMRSWIRRDDQN